MSRLGQRVARALRAIVVLLTVLLLVRAFATFSGWQRVVVSGGSMAPHFHGSAVAVRCEACGTSWRIDPTASGPDACPACGSDNVAVIGACPADRVYARRFDERESAARFDVVVLRSPQDPARHLLKRVIGRPGESVKLAEGDVFINGERLVKPLADQLRVRVPVASGPTVWQIADGEWRRTGPLTDDLPYNAHFSRRLKPMRDAMVEVDASLGPDGVLSVRPGWPSGLEVRFAVVSEDGGLRVEAELDESLIGDALVAADASLSATVSTFDRQLLVVVDADEVVTAELPDVEGNAVEPSVLQASGGEIDAARLYRDVYYEAPPGNSAWSLGADEWFVVGDNQAVSRDSRNWDSAAGVPADLILGVVP